MHFSLYTPAMRFHPTALLLPLLLVACAPKAPDTTDWKMYESALLELTIKYPPAFTQVHEIPDALQMEDGSELPLSALFVGEETENGEGVHVYRTGDARIVEYVGGDSLEPPQEINGMQLQRFESLGTGDGYGYVGKYGTGYLIFTSTQGPENAVSEAMLRSMTFKR
jgi:hypothetical protein